MSDIAVRCSTPHVGICADTLVLVSSSDIEDLRMCFVNADGSEALLCGSAARCVNEHLHSFAVVQLT